MSNELCWDGNLLNTFQNQLDKKVFLLYIKFLAESPLFMAES